jgi:hypothetical protein
MSLLAARDFLLRHRDDYDAVYAGFHPPQLSSQWPFRSRTTRHYLRATCEIAPRT